jgi:hypothetical protein
MKKSVWRWRRLHIIYTPLFSEACQSVTIYGLFFLLFQTFFFSFFGKEILLYFFFTFLRFFFEDFFGSAFITFFERPSY